MCIHFYLYSEQFQSLMQLSQKYKLYFCVLTISTNSAKAEPFKKKTKKNTGGCLVP